MGPGTPERRLNGGVMEVPDENPSVRATWEAPRLTFVGDIADVVRQGGGKLSLSPGDPGEPTRKPKGGE
jgi:hypothetical protein